MVKKVFWGDYGNSAVRDEGTLKLQKLVEEKAELTYSKDPASIEELLEGEFDFVILTPYWPPLAGTGEDISEKIYPYEAIFGKGKFREFQTERNMLMLGMLLYDQPGLSRLSIEELPDEIRSELENANYDAGTRRFPDMNSLSKALERIETLIDYVKLPLSVKAKLDEHGLYSTSGFYVADRLRKKSDSPIVFLTYNDYDEKAAGAIGNVFFVKESEIYSGFQKLLDALN
ncbi:TPA: hypothetical protein HA239_02720 [Candidatus Woesearchaeota archaeon]|nr:hypothetical protein QT06_C0001G1144 [archaeon GW2011_AR15]MBS3104385.1 hypothetical protein [Candidatus Woesearchaeota archaeon]HIH41302.1 hypothetical protein [Candidatus Woesearchaeota archaeon]